MLRVVSEPDFVELYQRDGSLQILVTKNRIWPPPEPRFYEAICGKCDCGEKADCDKTEDREKSLVFYHYRESLNSMTEVIRPTISPRRFLTGIGDRSSKSVSSKIPN